MNSVFFPLRSRIRQYYVEAVRFGAYVGAVRDASRTECDASDFSVVSTDIAIRAVRGAIVGAAIVATMPLSLTYYVRARE